MTQGGLERSKRLACEVRNGSTNLQTARSTGSTGITHPAPITIAPDNTGQKQSRWQPGHSGNPAGRPRGSRNKLSEAFFADFHATWNTHGRAALELVAQTQPAIFLRLAVQVLPMSVKVDLRRDRPVIELSDAELTAFILEAREALANDCGDE